MSSPRTDAPTFQIAGDDIGKLVSKSKRKTSTRRSSTPRVPQPAPDPITQPSGPDSDQPFEPEIAGFRSDDASGADLLDITDEVKRLCSVLAAKDVKPPVSIGLFGEWGSGKTFFMRQMEKEFNHIKMQARQVKGETAYCTNMVQLWFNAWHYIEENIWASLADEIFDGLSRALAFEAVGLPEKATAEQVGMGLRVEKDTVEKELDAAIKQKDQADVEVRATQEKLDNFQKQATLLSGESEKGKILSAAAEAAVNQPEIKNEVARIQQNLDKQVADVLKIRPEQARGAVSSELLKVQGITDDLGVIWSTLRHSKNPWIWAFSLAAAVLVIAVAPLLRPFADWLSPRVAALLGALIGVIAPALKFLSALSRIFKAQKQAIDQSIRTAQAKHEQQRAQLEKGHNASLAKAKDKEKVVEEKHQRLKTLDENLQKLRPDRQIIDFLESRQKSSDYKKHLGVIAQAHADFEELSILLAKVQEQENKREKEKEKQEDKDKTAQNPAADTAPDPKNGKEKSLPRIDRIVLYIDDLDRCPEDKVVDVLQAIHLLLFFPLFVVVVGVDPRWMLHSLRQHLRALQDVADGGNDLSDGERIGWESTPLNYLEKIFQIPYVVLPMQKKGFQQLVQSLTIELSSDGKQDAGKSVTVIEPQETLLSQGDPKPVPPPSGDIPGGGGVAVPTADPGKPSTPVVISVPEAFDPNPKHLQLQDCEREFMKLLHPLIHSPRAAKRFVNVYRLLRTSVDANELEMFVTKNKGGEYQAVQLLLAIQTGYPNQAVEITDDLIEQKPQESWWTFIQKYATRPKRAIVSSLRNPRRQESATPNVGNSRFKDEYWQEFVKCMNSLKPQIGDRSCADCVKWAPRVARYSFRSSRMLAS